MGFNGEVVSAKDSSTTNAERSAAKPSSSFEIRSCGLAVKGRGCVIDELEKKRECIRRRQPVTEAVGVRPAVDGQLGNPNNVESRRLGTD